MTRQLALLALLPLVLGCGSGRPEADVERGRRALVTALDNWKANDPPARLKSNADPVDFTEELSSTHSLLGYEIGKVDASDREVVRYTVALKLKDKKGKATDREVVYAVALKSPVVVSRDPYY